MDKELGIYLNKNKISFKEHPHQAVFTVEQLNSAGINFPFIHTKNLFLTDKKGNFFLFCLQADKKAPLKEIKRILNVKSLHFASALSLKEKLNLTPGSVSIFGLVYSSEVTLLLDKDIYDAPSVGFHPNINTSTLEINKPDFRKFYDSLINKKMVIKVA